MDAVNDAIEQSFEAQRAGHNHPDLDLSDDDDGAEDQEAAASDEPAEDTDTATNTEDNAGQPLSEAEHLRIIEEKLAQQQALLEARESDRQGGEEDNEQ